MAIDVTDIRTSARDAKATSRPISLYLPEAYKSADINARKGLITAYLTVYRNPDGTEFIDPYMDVISDGAFNKTVNDLNQARKSKNNPYLCADLWQHSRQEVIGGITNLTFDSKGVIYEAQLLLSVQRARECFDLCAAKMVGSSFGYDPVRFQHKGDIRYLNEVRLHEISQVSFPACDIAPILETKDNGTKFYVPDMPNKSPEKNIHTDKNNQLDFPHIPGEDNFIGTEDAFNLKAVVGFTGMAIGPRDEQWDYRTARTQYKAWGTDTDGFVFPDKYKQVHLLVDGNPKDATSYDYPYCYIVDGLPRICVDAVRQLIKSLKTTHTIEAPLMREKCVKMLERINTKYMHAAPLVDNQPMEFDYKQDFTAAWTRKLPAQMMQEFFRMSDTLTYVLLSNFDDDDISDKSSTVDACCGQFGSAVKDWLPEYLAAEEAQDALEDDSGSSDMMPMMGMYGMDMAGVSMKRTLSLLGEHINTKEGRALSDRNKKKLRETIDNINLYLTELSRFVDGDPHTDTEDGGIAGDGPKHSGDTYDITQGLTVLNTLTPDHTSSTSSSKAAAPISFPSVPNAEAELDITELLQSIQMTMKHNGGTD